MNPTDRRVQALQAKAALVQAGATAQIEALARAAFARMWQLLASDAGMAPRDAIQAAQVEFGGGFADALAQAFSDLLARSVGTAQVLAMPVGPMPLSRRLYQHATQTTNEVAALVQRHAQGVHQARELSLRLYDGYNPRDGVRRPLEGRARADLPHALRALTEDVPARRALTGLQVAGQEQAARLKSAPLRAAYSEAFEAWKDGAGQEALRRRLQIAQREKNRYFANRIAQTELARAHQARVAAEFMADDSIDVLEVRINPKHPRTDICDMHARANLFGLGPGCYPKARTPRPPYHSFCWCRVRSRPDLAASDAREVLGGEAAYLRSLSPEEAGRVMGSKARAAQVLDGASVEAVTNAGKDAAYRLARVGDGAAAVHALGSENVVVSKPTPTPRDIASFAADAVKAADRLVTLPLGRVTNAAAIKAATGFDLAGFERILDNYGIRHTMKQHGTPAAEAARGQIAVSLDDFGLIPLITSAPDTVSHDGKNKIGRDVLVFTKLIDGIGYRHVEEIRGKKKLVATDSMRKKKGPWGP